MSKPIFSFLVALLAIIVHSVFSAHDAQAHIFRVEDKSMVPLASLLSDLHDARVIFHGELHDNAGHHRSQLQLIRALHEQGTKIAIGLEMLPQGEQSALNKWIFGDMDLATLRTIFTSHWGYWPLYKEIFIQRALGMHAAHPGSFENFCEAQLLWDKVMAENLKRYLEENPSRSVFVIAGSGHSWKQGIPLHFEDDSRLAYRVLLPEIPGRWTPDLISPEDADYILLGIDYRGAYKPRKLIYKDFAKFL